MLDICYTEFENESVKRINSLKKKNLMYKYLPHVSPLY